MKTLDRALQRWRIEKAAPHIAQGDWVLDVGCANGALFRVLANRVAGGVGIDPDLAIDEQVSPNIRLVRGTFPEDLRTDERFDVITMLAVLSTLMTTLRGEQPRHLRRSSGRAAVSCLRFPNR